MTTEKLTSPEVTGAIVRLNVAAFWIGKANEFPIRGDFIEWLNQHEDDLRFVLKEEYTLAKLSKVLQIPEYARSYVSQWRKEKGFEYVLDTKTNRRRSSGVVADEEPPESEETPPQSPVDVSEGVASERFAESHESPVTEDVPEAVEKLPDKDKDFTTQTISEGIYFSPHDLRWLNDNNFRIIWEIYGAVVRWHLKSW